MIHFRKLSSFTLLSYLVIGIHATLLSLLLFAPPSVLEFRTKPMKIRTVEAKARKVNAPSSHLKQASKPATKKEVVSSKKEDVKTEKPQAIPKKNEPIKKVEAAKKKVIEPEASNKKAQSPKNVAPSKKNLAPLIAELEERIAKIDKNPDKVSERDVKDNTSIDKRPLHVDTLSSFAQNSESYDISEDLIGFLHESLQLPDFGKVKVKMIISATGIVKKIEVLESESEENRKYLEVHLPGLRFPFMDKALYRQSEKSYVVNFCNEI